MIFKIYDCDFGFKLAGVNYDFPHVMEFQVEDPETTKLTRGANASNKIGISYKEGIKDPKRISVTVLGMTAEIKAVLDAAYAAQTRLDPYAVSRADGSSKIYKNAVLSTQPQQLSISDSADSMNVTLIFESFDAAEVHKS